MLILQNIKLNSLAAKLIIAVSLLSGMSQINIPMHPVPVNLATIAVMLVGLFYSSKEAFLSLFSYLLLGIIGAPVFNNYSGGIGYFLGFTGGYLLGYLFAAVCMAFLRETFFGTKEINIFNIFILCVIGQSLIFLCGVLWLAGFIGFHKAVYSGFFVFIIPGFLKIFILSGIIKYTVLKK